MARVRVRRLLVSLVVAAVLAGAVAPPAAAAAPEVTVSVAGSTLADGGSITVTDDPDVGVEVSADSTLDSVSIRVDGDPVRTFTPDSKSFSTTVTLDLTDGNHDLTVVASADETTTHGGTVVKDSAGPRVRYTAPFTTSRQASPDDVETIEHGNATIAGDLWDRSGVERVRIERVYEWKFAGRTRTDKTTHRISDPGESFSRPLLFGPGDNEMKVTLVDVHGHKRIQEWTIDLEDRTKPTVAVDVVRRSSDGSKVFVNGTVSDDTKVRSLSYTLEGSSSTSSVLSRVDSEPTRERVSTEFEFTTSAGSGTDSLTLVAKDTAGNTRRKTVSLNFEQRVAPEISIDRGATARDGDEVRVVGTVDDGRVTRVTVETVHDGEVLSLRTVHDGEAVRSVAIDERLAVAGEGTEVIVRATDTMDREHRRTLTVGEAVGTESGGGGGGDGAATATPASGDTPAADGGGGSDGGDGGDAQNQVGAGDGGSSFPLAGPVGLVVAAVALAGVGLVARRMLGSDDAPAAGADATADDPGAPADAEGADADTAAAAGAPPEPGREASCPECGADVRASATRCPECGSSVGAGAPGDDGATGDGTSPWAPDDADGDDA
ncbi:MAG: zinc ribbon domain-containing protein, partial [Haloferacaceae archaeon]